MEYISKRESDNYDSGAKLADIDGVLSHRSVILEWQKQGVPCFESIGAAAESLSR